MIRMRNSLIAHASACGLWIVCLGLSLAAPELGFATTQPAQLVSSCVGTCDDQIVFTCVGDCDGDLQVTVNEIISLVNIALGNPGTCPHGLPDGGTVTVTQIITAVDFALGSAACVEPTIAPAATPTPTVSPVGGVLGKRHFVLGPKSTFQIVLGSGLALTLGVFQGQSQGQTEPGFMDLQAGAPDPATGIASVDVTDSSEFFFVQNAGFGIVLCLKLHTPAPSAGIVDCNGTLDFSTVLTQNHNIGQVGVDGFTAAQCASMGGSVESPNQICAAGMLGEVCRTNTDCDSSSGSGDGVCGLLQSFCTSGKGGGSQATQVPCQSDADCDTMIGALDGVCGRSTPYPGVCNGPFSISQIGSPTGPGAVILAPLPQFGLSGVPVELTMETALPCGDEGSGLTTPFAFTTGLSRTTILNVNNNHEGTNSTYDVTGLNFSCVDWSDMNGPGAFVLAAPSLDVPQVGDIIAVFRFDGSAPSPTPTPTGHP
jgi:hypothetical protein